MASRRSAKAACQASLAVASAARAPTAPSALEKPPAIAAARWKRPPWGGSRLADTVVAPNRRWLSPFAAGGKGEGCAPAAPPATRAALPQSAFLPIFKGTFCERWNKAVPLPTAAAAVGGTVVAPPPATAVPAPPALPRRAPRRPRARDGSGGSLPMALERTSAGGDEHPGDRGASRRGRVKPVPSAPHRQLSGGVTAAGVSAAQTRLPPGLCRGSRSLLRRAAQSLQREPLCSALAPALGSSGGGTLGEAAPFRGAPTEAPGLGWSCVSCAVPAPCTAQLPEKPAATQESLSSPGKSCGRRRSAPSHRCPAGQRQPGQKSCARADAGAALAQLLAPHSRSPGRLAGTSAGRPGPSGASRLGSRGAGNGSPP